jgi:hypothetical protein
MRVPAFLALALALAACSSSSSDMPVQDPAAVVAAFNAVIAGCARPLTEAGGIDQRALAASGWAVTARTTRFEVTNTTHALTDYPTLRAGEYEATEWRRAGQAGEMELIRQDTLSAVRSFDHCSMNGRVSEDAAPQLLAAMTRRFGHVPDRSGVVPRGGDGLTPRFFPDPDPAGYHWAMPTHDVYLTVFPEGGANIDVVAMPDRNALDEYSSDRPSHRIYVPGETSQ